MKTMKQVLAEFQRMQNQLWGKFGQGAIEVRAYDQGNGHWSVSILVSRLSEDGINHDVWGSVIWINFGPTIQNDDDEQYNEEILAEFKKKFNLK